MKLVIGECSAIYSGRGDSSLARGLRAVIVKDDGSVSIHNDVGNKPLNYMKTPTFSETVNEEGERVWNFDARHESLIITLHTVQSSIEQKLTDAEPGLTRDGTEHQLQKWLAEHPQVLGENFTFVKREFQTGAGAVDILALDEAGLPVAVEIKRVAMLGAADQVRRYVDAMRALPPEADLPGIDFSKTRGMIAALNFRPKALELAEKRNIEVVTIPPYWREKDGATLKANGWDQLLVE